MTEPSSLHELPPAVSAALSSARDAQARRDTQAARKALVAALEAVSFPTTFPKVIYPIAETLTPAQHSVAEAIARMDTNAVWEWMPSGATALRWLGLEPPGPLETPVSYEGAQVPLWRALCLAQEGKRAAELIASLPMPLRMDTIAMLGRAAAAYRVSPDPDGAWAIAGSSLRDEGRAWALSRLGSATTTLEKIEAVAAIGEQLAFLALVRAGHPIEPAWDHFVPIGTPVPPAIAAECAAALPLERLERVAPTLLQKTFGPKAIQTGLALLERHASPAIARFVWATSERSFPHNRDAERRALLAIAEREPALLEALAPLRAGAPAPRTLTVTARLAPRSEADLSQLQAEQLVAAGRAWDGETLPVARRLSVDENDEAAIGFTLEHLTIAEHGKPAFEAWLYQGDSGTFFTAGTTDVVAHRLQGGVELVGKKKDPALVDALGRIGESKDAARPIDEVRSATQAGLAAKKAPAKKAPAKKAPTKKAPTKKAPAKKAPAKKTPPKKTR